MACRVPSPDELDAREGSGGGRDEGETSPLSEVGVLTRRLEVDALRLSAANAEMRGEPVERRGECVGRRGGRLGGLQADELFSEMGDAGLKEEELVDGVGDLGLFRDAGNLRDALRYSRKF